MRSGAILDVGIIVAGGAAAGFADAKFPDKKIGPAGPGTILAVAGIAAGLTLRGRMSSYALEIGKGAAAFEIGKMVANKTAGSVSGVRGVRGVRGVAGTLPQGRHPLTQEELNAVLANQRATARAA